MQVRIFFLKYQGPNFAFLFLPKLFSSRHWLDKQLFELFRQSEILVEITSSVKVTATTQWSFYSCKIAGAFQG